MAVALGGTFRSLDGIKESLYAGGVQTHNPYGLRLAAEQELVVQLAAAKGTVVVDLWIAPGRDTDRIKALLAPQDKEIVELLCRVPADLAVARYARRTRSGPHRPPDEPTLQRIREATDVLKPIGLGTCIEVDTSRHVDIHKIIEQLRLQEPCDAEAPGRAPPPRRSP